MGGTSLDFKDAVAVSYAQDGEKYNEQVMGFVDLLRKKIWL